MGPSVVIECVPNHKFAARACAACASVGTLHLRFLACFGCRAPKWFAAADVLADAPAARCGAGYWATVQSVVEVDSECPSHFLS